MVGSKADVFVEPVGRVHGWWRWELAGRRQLARPLRSSLSRLSAAFPKQMWWLSYFFHVFSLASMIIFGFIYAAFYIILRDLFSGMDVILGTLTQRTNFYFWFYFLWITSGRNVKWIRIRSNLKRGITLSCVKNDKNWVIIKCWE